MKTIDIIVPCYNEQEVLQKFYAETGKVVNNIKEYVFQFLFVDDGSTDNTIQIIEKLAARNKDVRYLSFSRNFGKEAAIYAGLKYASGEYVILMDADLQHPPALIPAMISGIEEGYDCCAAKRMNRDGESRLRSAFSHMFYKISNCITDIQIPQNAVDFRMMSAKMVHAVLQISEVERFSKGIFAWIGFQTKWIPYENVERTEGTTKWSFLKLLKYAAGGVTSFSIMPLRIVSCMGFVIFILAGIYIAATVIRTFAFGIEVPGYVTTLSAVLFLGGILELSIGIVGEYVAHIYMETKNRPVYILKQSNFETEK